MNATLMAGLSNAFMTSLPIKEKIPAAPDGETIVETSKDMTVNTVSSTKMMLEASRVSKN